MLRISKLSDYAIVLLTTMAEQHSHAVNAVRLAERTGLAKPTVTKLLKLLAADGLLQSIQGRHGGYQLAIEPADISIRRIIEAVDGPIAITECSHTTGDCGIEQTCHSRGHWQQINRAVRQALADVKLEQLAQEAARPEAIVMQRMAPLRSEVG
mgnify:CR=1 FL=1